MSRCDDKRHTRRILARAGLPVPAGRDASFDEADHAFLHEVGEVVVKPARGEQGAGITVGVTTDDELDAALAAARCALPRRAGRGAGARATTCASSSSTTRSWPPRCAGRRRSSAPAGTPCATWSRRRAGAGPRPRAASRRSRSTTRPPAPVEAAGRTLDDVLPEGERLAVRRTANLHTGGTIHDVTAELHPELAARGRGRVAGHRHPGHRARHDRAPRRRARRRVHRGQRAARARQPRAAADRRALRRPAVPHHPGAALGLATRPTVRRPPTGCDRPRSGAEILCGRWRPSPRSTCRGCSTCSCGCCARPARRGAPTPSCSCSATSWPTCRSSWRSPGGGRCWPACRAENEGARAVVAHADTIGCMVRDLKANGRLAVVPVGTHSSRFAEGCRVTILTDDSARTYTGTVLPLLASGHAYGDDVDIQPTGWDHVEVRVDEPCADAADLAGPRHRGRRLRRPRLAADRHRQRVRQRPAPRRQGRRRRRPRGAARPVPRRPDACRTRCTCSSPSPRRSGRGPATGCRRTWPRWCRSTTPCAPRATTRSRTG